jgi:predicted metal-dependent HD superfamily phosphohydrolase
MKIYLAARFDRKVEMKELSQEIKVLGVEVTSRWLDEAPMPHGKEEREQFLLDTAAMDRDDVKSADVLVRFSDDLSTLTIPARWGTASRMEETGMAYAWGKKIVIVGGRQSLFDHFADRVQLQGKAELLTWFRQQIYLETWEGVGAITQADGVADRDVERNQ